MRTILEVCRFVLRYCDLKGLIEQHGLEHNISGEVLCLLDAEGLKDMGIATIGQRLAILKAVYNLKVAHNIPIEHGHYVPPCEPGLLFGLPCH